MATREVPSEGTRWFLTVVLMLSNHHPEFKLLNDWIKSLEEEEVTQAPATAPTARGFFEDVQLVSPSKHYAERLLCLLEVAYRRRDCCCTQWR